MNTFISILTAKELSAISPIFYAGLIVNVLPGYERISFRARQTARGGRGETGSARAGPCAGKNIVQPFCIGRIRRWRMTPANGAPLTQVAAKPSPSLHAPRMLPNHSICLRRQNCSRFFSQYGISQFACRSRVTTSTPCGMSCTSERSISGNPASQVSTSTQSRGESITNLIW